MDKLTAAYDEWAAKNATPSEFQCFQGGYSASAVSMRNRALKLAQAAKKPDNDLINAIGQLPDVEK